MADSLANSPDAVEIDGMICVPKQTEEKKDSEENGGKSHLDESDRLYACPHDPRFQEANKTKWCYQMFLDYHRCKFLLGEGSECQYFYKCYVDICPFKWVEEWEEQIQNGSFPRDITRKAYYRKAA